VSGTFLIRTECAFYFRDGCLACLRRSVLVKPGVQSLDFLSYARFKWVSATYNLIDQNQIFKKSISYRSKADPTPGTGAAWLNNRYENM
jgi:hypothetical protein